MEIYIFLSQNSLSMGRAWSSEPGHSLCINEGSVSGIYTGTWGRQMAWMAAQGYERKNMERLGQGGLGRGIWMNIWEWG